MWVCFTPHIVHFASCCEPAFTHDPVCQHCQWLIISHSYSIMYLTNYKSLFNNWQSPISFGKCIAQLTIRAREFNEVIEVQQLCMIKELTYITKIVTWYSRFTPLTHLPPQQMYESNEKAHTHTHTPCSKCNSYMCTCLLYKKPDDHTIILLSSVIIIIFLTSVAF